VPFQRLGKIRECFNGHSFRADDLHPLTVIQLQLFALPRLRMPSSAVITPYLCHDEFNNLPPMILLEDFD
jgi:hypothetical protein